MGLGFSLNMDALKTDISACRICSNAFGASATAHAPRPIVWLAQNPRILIAGQAPGLRVHQSGVPFDDPSGDRLRDWMGIDKQTFYDRDRVAIVPMAFCFPGYDAKGSDLAPPKVCAETWRQAVMTALGEVPLTLVIGKYAQAWHLGKEAAKTGVRATVANWRNCETGVFPLPHPSWRNTGWLKRTPWFDSELVPALRAQVKEVLDA